MGIWLLVGGSFAQRVAFSEWLFAMDHYGRPVIQHNSAKTETVVLSVTDPGHMATWSFEQLAPYVPKTVLPIETCQDAFVVVNGVYDLSSDSAQRNYRCTWKTVGYIPVTSGCRCR